MKQITYEGDEQRLDVYISGLLNIARNQAQKEIKNGNVKVNGILAKPNKIVTQGDEISFSKKAATERPKEIPDVNIIYEDENIIVVDKDAGVVVHPADGNESGTLVDALRDKINIRDKERPGVVHRLDKDTSGLIVFAKNEESLEYLQDQIKSRKFEKIYLALVWGKVEPKKGSIDIPIQRSEKDRKKMEASHSGREAMTEYEVIKYYDKMTLLKVRIITGRTHQIRVHFAGIGYPVVGDKTYGSRSSVIPAQAGTPRQFLHAHELGFELFGEKHHFKSELPKDLEIFLRDVGI